MSNGWQPIYTTQAQVRDAFWHLFCPGKLPRGLRSKSQNELSADIRMSFCDFVDQLVRDEQISEKLASKVTL